MLLCREYHHYESSTMLIEISKVKLDVTIAVNGDAIFGSYIFS